MRGGAGAGPRCVWGHTRSLSGGFLLILLLFFYSLLLFISCQSFLVTVSRKPCPKAELSRCSGPAARCLGADPLGRFVLEGGSCVILALLRKAYGRRVCEQPCLWKAVVGQDLTESGVSPEHAALFLAVFMRNKECWSIFHKAAEESLQDSEFSVGK